MKTISSYVFPVVLIILGGALLIVGLIQGQNVWVLLGATLALVAGIISLMAQLGVLSKQAGMVIGIAFLVLAVVLAYRNYRSIAEVIEFNEAKRINDSKVIQALKDIREAQKGYRDAHHAYTGNPEELRRFVKSGTIPMIRAIGQVPDTLTEVEAIELGLIVRDTIMVPALDSLFMTQRALEKRVYPFNPDSFIYSPVSPHKTFLLDAGTISSSGRNVPVFQVIDPTPMVANDVLMLGSMDKATTAGNWSGE